VLDAIEKIAPKFWNQMTRIFVAGATGAVGNKVLKLAPSNVELAPHVRPGSESKIEHPNTVAIDLSDENLAAKMINCTCVMQLIGTMAKRFSTGDTYETSDIGTTRYLVNAAKKAHVQHFVLLSSTGAGSPMGAYLKAKAAAEKLVTESGIPYTIFRPSAFEDREGVSVPGVRAITTLFGLHKWKPIRLSELAGSLLFSASTNGPLNTILEGKSLWDVVAKSAPRG
jgi:hypothetical protein